MLLSSVNNVMDEKSDAINWGQVLYLAGLLDFASVYVECEETLGMQCLHFIGVHRLSDFFRQIYFHFVSILGAEIITIDRLEFENYYVVMKRKQ